MRHHERESRSQALQDLSAAQVAAIVERSGLDLQELSAKLGCGTSQLFKYQKEGLPPRMNREVRAAILQLGMETGVLADNAVARTSVKKLSKGRLFQTKDAGDEANVDMEPDQHTDH